MASNVFNDIDPPPFVDLIAAEPLLSSLSSSGGSRVNGDIYWMQVKLRRSADAPAGVENMELSVRGAEAGGVAGLERDIGCHARDPAAFGARDVDELIGAQVLDDLDAARSEERRVGKECRSR